ncbi:MAG: hypothetical protein KDD66_09140 [Bdellovibrionales bacterium]|nr:hypothetical protein [Bdellovibrionales bacterium]
MYIAALEQIASSSPVGICHPSSKLPAPEASCSGNGSRRASPSKETTLGHYRNIGNALLICEASSYRVGIPWILPIGEVAARRYDVGTQPGDYIRESLVTVSTNCLQMYIEDLELSGEKQLSDSDLFIDLKTWVERSSFTAACIAAFAFFGSAGAAYLAPSPVTCFISGMVMMVCGYMLGQSYTTSEWRRASFHKLLNNEAMRRRGIDPDGPSGTRVYTGPATPLSE